MITYLENFFNTEIKSKYGSDGAQIFLINFILGVSELLFASD